MDISTGRCPTKQKKCDCRRVCAALYGQEARRLKSAIDEGPKELRDHRLKEWQGFVKKNSKRI
ncbi:hypothetical protein KP77_25100 [Jeotgalibacillus alimentarius]|uniref:Uncharacterized protein n=1 Tax=Jeotgalibacillus alimentarius TaxID=135826 RepID=A0A0C2VR68_9BACL|nr:hypothetical protein [Jeotgalibacillus alimentarius]KIL46941.1 hypothetical protein KP77_25100 [Jeotgalibacillus alimentarius]